MAWIRSQDKQHLFLATSVYVAFTNLYAELPNDTDPNMGGRLIGNFASKDWAMKELDAIERWLEDYNGKGVYQVGGEQHADL